jgi:nucleoid-associated protein YgaU
MHSIERYGIVALLFLVVTVVAVLMWDGGKGKGKEKPVAGLTPAAPAAVEPGTSRSQPAPADAPVRLVAESQPGPLQRRPRGGERSRAASEAQPIGAANVAAPSGEPAGAPLAETSLVPAEPRPESERAPVRLEPSPAGRAYTVKKGDTLSEIALRELGSSKRWPELVAANPGLDPAKLKLGATIRIPGSNRVGAPEAPKASEPKSAAPKIATGGKTWKVGPGESLWRIAERALGDGNRWREIAALNPEVNPDRLSTGTVLVLPAGASAPARTSPAPKRPAPPPVVASTQGSRDAARGGRRVR